MWGVAIFKAGTESGRNNPADPSVLIVCSTYKPACHLSAPLPPPLSQKLPNYCLPSGNKLWWWQLSSSKSAKGLQQVKASLPFICSICSHFLVEDLSFFQETNRGGDSSAAPSPLRAYSRYKPGWHSSAVICSWKVCCFPRNTNRGGDSSAVPSPLRAYSRYKPVWHPFPVILSWRFVFLQETNRGGDSWAVPSPLRACSRHKPLRHASAAFFSWRCVVFQEKPWWWQLSSSESTKGVQQVQASLPFTCSLSLSWRVCCFPIGDKLRWWQPSSSNSTKGVQQVQASLPFICSHFLVEGLLFPKWRQTAVVTT